MASAPETDGQECTQSQAGPVVEVSLLSHFGGSLQEQEKD